MLYLYHSAIHNHLQNICHLQLCIFASGRAVAESIVGRIQRDGLHSARRRLLNVKCTLENIFIGHIDFSPYTCCEMCYVSFGNFSKCWLKLIFVGCSLNNISTFDERERLQLPETFCLRNPALQTFLFFTTSNISTDSKLFDPSSL